LSALGQLDELFKDKDKWVLMSDRVDQLLVACYMQYRNVLNNKMGDPEVLKVLNYITAVLLSMYHHNDLALNATTSALYDLLQVIISILLDPTLQTLKNGSSGLLRALNVLTVKILDRSNPTNVTCAFVKLLHHVVGNNAPPKNIELVMKCLWKVIRLLPKWIEEDRVDLDVVLSELHVFLKEFPTSYWKRQEMDTPMRTVKTMLHTMAKSRGDAILDNLTKVPDTNGSELVPYLKKLLNSGVGGKENQNNGGTQGSQSTGSMQLQPPNNNNINAGNSGSKLPRFSKSDHDQLAEIFRKIGDKEQTKQGLQELKNFQQQCPHADLEPFLAKSSSYFRKYIERGLASIEPTTTPTTTTTLPTSGSQSDMLSGGGGNHNILSENRGVVGGGDGNTPSAFMNKLKALREKAGLESNNNPYGGGGGGGGSAASESGISSGTSSAASSNMYRISNFSTATTEHGNVAVSTEEFSSSSSVSTLVGQTDSQATESVDSAAAAGMDDIRRRFERVKMNSAF